MICHCYLHPFTAGEHRKRKTSTKTILVRFPLPPIIFAEIMATTPGPGLSHPYSTPISAHRPMSQDTPMQGHPSHLLARFQRQQLDGLLPIGEEPQRTSDNGRWH